MKFKARKGFINWLFYAVGIIFLFFGLFIGSGWSSKNARLFVILFSVVWLLLLLYRDLTFGSYYSVESNMVIFTIHWIFKKKIPIEDIKEIRKVSAENLGEIAHYEKPLRTFNPENIVEQNKSSYSYNKRVTWCTAPIQIKTYKYQPSKTIAKGDFVFISLKNNEEYIISPEDVDGFIKAVKLHSF